jgi:hypothetical protein
MNKRAGIFDPWRQSAAPAVDNTPVRKTPSETPLDTTHVEDLHCIQFNGLRAGIFVWVPEKDADDGSRARATLIDVIHRISAREGIAKVLHSWGVYVGTPKQANPIVLADGDKKMTIAVPVDDAERLVPRAIDMLSLALREVAQQFPDVRDMLFALKVRPYLK